MANYRTVIGYVCIYLKKDAVMVIYQKLCVTEAHFAANLNTNHSDHHITAPVRHISSSSSKGISNMMQQFHLTEKLIKYSHLVTVVPVNLNYPATL